SVSFTVWASCVLCTWGKLLMVSLREFVVGVFPGSLMSSVQHLRDFISERLTAAAEEIFGVFERTIVQYEEEMDRQRRLLDVTWRPQVHLDRTGEELQVGEFWLSSLGPVQVK
ncbi:hypothetical protein GOODEAATRI_014588, partial [Goodea atripinnis]